MNIMLKDTNILCDRFLNVLTNDVFKIVTGRKDIFGTFCLIRRKLDLSNELSA